MTENKIVALVFLMLISISAISQGSFEKYYRSCDGLNNPLLAHFSKPILKNQKENLPGRYFKVTYGLNRRTRVYRLDKIEHYFLDQPQPVYDYKKGVDAKINYAQFQKVSFTYDEYDNIEKIEYRDKNGAPAENSNGISKFEYQKRSNRSFNYSQKTFYLDTIKKHKIRNATFDNNGDLYLYFVSKNINDKRVRVLSKYRSNSSGISKKLDYKGSDKQISTSYYHPNTNQRTYNAIDGTFLLIEKFNNEGFLVSQKSEDRIGMPVGLNLSYTLQSEGSKYVYRLIEGENGLNFSKGTDFKLKKYNADYDLTNKELCNGDMVKYTIEPVPQGVKIKSSRSGSKKITRVVIKNNKGLLLSRVTVQNGDKSSFEITYHLDFLSNGGVKGENLKYPNDTRKNNQIDVCSKMPMIKKYYYANGYLKKEERYNSDNKILGSEIVNTSKAYPYDCVPVINYDYYPNGDLHFKYVQDAKEEYFNPEKISSYFIDSDFFKDWAKESYGFINFIAYGNNPNKRFSETAYYNRLGTVDLNSINPQSYIFKVVDTYYPSKGKYLTTAKSENTEHAIDNNQNKNIHTIERKYDKFNRLESSTTSYLDGNIENTVYTYTNEYLPNEMYSGVKYYKKEGDNGTNKPWMKYGYHKEEVLRDKRGNVTLSKKRDENYEIINSIRDAAFVQNSYNGGNRISEMIFKDSSYNNKKINLWKYSDQAIYKIKRQIDSRGNVTKQTVYTEAPMANVKRDIKLDEIIKKYDQRDNIIFEYKTLRGKPVLNEDDTYIQKMDYDVNNNLSIIMNYDATGKKPMADSEGYYGYSYTYNGDRLEISKRFLSRDYKFQDVLTDGEDFEDEDGNAKKHGTNIHMETYEYDKDFNKIATKYFTDKKGEFPAVDNNGVHCIKEHFDMDSYNTDILEYFGEDMKHINGPGFAKKVFKFDENGRKIMTKRYRVKNDKLVLQYKIRPDEGSYEYYERVSIDDKSKRVTYYKEGKESDALPATDENGLHEIEVLYDGSNNSQIKSISFWGLRKGKRNKINVSDFERLEILLQLDKAVAKHIQEVHEVDLTYINNRIYINCFNAKGKPSQFTLNGRSYEFLELSSDGIPISLMEGIPHKL